MGAADVFSPESLRLSPHANLKIIILPDEPAIQQLHVDVVVRLEGRISFAFAFDPQAVEVSTVPALHVPTEIAIVTSWAVFENLGAQERVIPVAVSWVMVLALGAGGMGQGLLLFVEQGFCICCRHAHTCGDG